MPPAHRRFLERVEAMPDVRGVATAARYNAALERVARFREIHLGWARRYVDERVADPRGTGGTPFMMWLGQLLEETRAHALRD
jgi:indoleamine 2,3-dioxygenase